ncbi:MAG: hypothetical protein SR1Q7_10230 [Quinella sp. 1Q7]|nr:hypothetical protein [Quinella sp. 1Q7]
MLNLIGFIESETPARSFTQNIGQNLSVDRQYFLVEQFDNSCIAAQNLFSDDKTQFQPSHNSAGQSLHLIMLEPVVSAADVMLTAVETFIETVAAFYFCNRRRK